MKTKKIFPKYNEKYVYDGIIDNGNEFLYVRGAGIVYPDDRYEFTKTRKNYLFEYVVSGKGYVETDGIRRIVSAGDCIIHKKGEKVSYGADKTEPYIKLWFSVYGSYVDNLYAGFAEYAEKKVIVRKTSVYPVFEKVISCLGEGSADTAFMAHSILDIMLSVCGGTPLSKDVNLSGAKQIKMYIDTFIQQKVDFALMARHLGMTEREAVREFEREYGITPAKYLQEARLEAARELLERTNKSVSYIAHRMNFCAQSYFSTAFRNRYGLYPSEYREKRRNKKH